MVENDKLSKEKNKAGHIGSDNSDTGPCHDSAYVAVSCIINKMGRCVNRYEQR